MKHVLIINRYDDELSDYRNYIDHSQVDVSYISLAGHSRLIDPQVSANVVEVSALDADLILRLRRVGRGGRLRCRLLRRGLLRSRNDRGRTLHQQRGHEE